MKRRLPLLLLVLLAAGAVLLRQGWRRALGQGTGAALAALHGMGVMGFVALAGAQFLVAASGVLPASMLGVAAGAAYGIWWGFLVAGSGVLLGALASFALSRSVFRPFVARRLANAPRLAHIDRGLARDGWRFVCLLRLSPIMPFALASYALGVSSVGWGAYCVGTLASMPALLLYVFLGTLARVGAHSLETGSSAWSWLLLVVGGLATVALSLRIGQIAMRRAEAEME